MGRILESKEREGHIVYKIELDEKEAVQIQGHHFDIKLFSSECCTTQANVVEKGIRGATKHFVLPTKYRSKSKKKPEVISYQSIDLDSKTVFIYGLKYS